VGTVGHGADGDLMRGMKTCKRCGGIYPLVFFRRNPDDRLRATAVARTRDICIGCELTARTTAKKRNRPREKARRTLDAHADKYIKQGLADSRKQFAAQYGWNLDQMAHDIDFVYGNGCPYCHRPFSEMEHGLADVTLDVINPDLPPYYETNCRWVCTTCNREKGKTDPALWGQKLQAWKQWRELAARREQDIYAGLPLFEGRGM